MIYYVYNSVSVYCLFDCRRQRFGILDPIFNEVCKTETLYLTAISNQLNTIMPELKKQLTVELQKEPSDPPCLNAKPPEGLNTGDNTNTTQQQKDKDNKNKNKTTLTNNKN